jgi:sigma-B regulation protein RsbU (phosphoserine phosphatase)
LQEDRMNLRVLDQIRQTLSAKRNNLSDWLAATPASKQDLQLGNETEQAVLDHLDTLGQAAEKAGDGSLGLCDVCHDYVETRLLEMDYTSCVCLEHFSDEERRTLEFELEMAQTVQLSLLPQQPPQTPSLEVAAFSRPSQIIGGDYFDFLDFLDGGVGLAIADVAGHGVSASLHMAGIQTLLRSLAPGSVSPAAALEHIHRLLVHNVRFTTFVTMFLGAFDTRSNILTYCNAGHNPPLVLRGGQNDGETTSWLWPTAAAVGLVEQGQFHSATIHLAPGDLLLMYTDGITEASNRQGEEFGRERLEASARSASRLPAAELIRSLRQAVEAFSGEESQADDQTLLVCKIAQ